MFKIINLNFKIVFISICCLSSLYSFNPKNSSYLKLKLGYVPIKNIASDLPDHAIVTEIGYESHLLDLKKNTVSLSGSYYFFIWDDFINNPTEKLRDNATWSTTCLGTGIRSKLNVKLIHNTSLQLYTGLAYIYYYYDYVGGTTFSDTNNFSYKYWFYELGATLKLRIFKRVDSIIEYSLFKTIEEYYINQGHIKIGLQYSLK